MIAVIGSRGFLGSHFMEALGDRAMGFNRSNASDFTHIDFTDWPWSEKYNLIIHCAIPTHKPPAPMDLIQQSQIDANIIRWWRDYQPDATLVTFGTDVCYGEKAEGLHREIDYLAAHPYSNWYHYAIAKRASANLLMTIPKRSFHCPITSLFGPGFRLEDDHLIHSLVRKIVDGQTFGTPVHLGCGDDLKECVYTPDLVQNVMKLQDTRCFNNLRIFNLGSPKKRDTIARIAELICAEIGYPFEKVSFSLSDASSSKKWLDSTMAQTEIKLADTEWTEALQKTIAYYMTIQECNSCESH